MPTVVRGDSYNARTLRDIFREDYSTAAPVPFGDEGPEDEEPDPAQIPAHHRDSGGPRRNGRNGRRRSGGDMDRLRRRRRELLRRREDLAFDTDLEPPERDQDRSRLNKIITGVGSLGALAAALGGSEIGAAAGEGLAQGGASNLQQQRESFRRRRESFREGLRNRMQFNRELEQSGIDERLAAIDDQIRRRMEQKMTPEERKKFQKELDLLDARIGAREALTEERRADAEAARRPDESGTTDEESDEPTVGDLRNELVTNSKVMSERARQWAQVQTQLTDASEGGGQLSEAGEAQRDDLRQRAAELQEEIDELAAQNARIRSRIEQQRGTTPPGEAGRTQSSPVPQDASPEAKAQETGGVLQEVRRIEGNRGQRAALQHLRSLIESERIDRQTANAVLDSLNVQ